MARTWTILRALLARFGRDNLSGLAAAIAFYALFSIFPALAAIVSIYGLVADPATVAREADALGAILPPEALKLIVTWLDALIHGPPAKFGFGLVASVTLALWSGWSAMSMLMTALTICYGERETRGFIAFNLRAVALTASLALVAVAPLVLLGLSTGELGGTWLPPALHRAVTLLRWPLLAVVALAALAILYRYAPARRQPRWQWLSWGAVAATALWLAASLGFSFYVSTFGSYDRTYGSLGAVVILLLWFYLTAYATLLGAEFNAEIERLAHERNTSRRRARQPFTAPPDLV
jgi:membrane protein